MKTKHPAIRPLMWSYDGRGRHQDHQISLDAFFLPEEVYAAMQRQTWREKANGGQYIGARLGGLGEVLALDVSRRPAFFTTGYNRQVGRKTLVLYWLNGDGERARPALEQALKLWLQNTYGAGSDEMLPEMTGSVDNPENWGPVMVSSEPPQSDILCGGPNDTTYYDALAALVGTHLAGKSVAWPDGSMAPLIPMVPQGGLYGGFELLIGTPRQVEAKSGDVQFFSRVLTITTASLAGHKTLGTQVLASVSTRHWGSITEKGPYINGKLENRSLDVVRNPGADPSCALGWHAKLRFVAEVTEDDRGCSPWKAEETHPMRPQWKNADAASVLKRLLDFQPGQFPRIGTSGQMIPAYSETAGAWVLPIFSTRAGDTDAAVGTGVGFPDRLHVMRAVDQELQTLGLVQSEPFVRPNRRLSASVKNIVPKKHKGTYPIDGVNKTFMEAISCAAVAAGSKGTLDIVVLAVGESTSEEVRDALAGPTGICWRASPNERVWESEGHDFRLRLKEVKSGPFNPRLRGGVDAGKKPPTVPALGEHFDRCCGSFKPDIAIVEMDGRLRGNKVDPYQNAYAALHRRNVLPQALLLDSDKRSGGKPTEKRTAARKAKVEHATLDCLRMLGVVVVDEKQLEDMAFAGLSVILTTPGRRPIPVAVLATTSGLKAARLTSDAEAQAKVTWEPYGKFLLDVRKGVVASSALPEEREDDKQCTKRIESFMQAVLCDLNERLNKCLVMIDGVAVRRFFPAMKNDFLAFDRIGFGFDASQWVMTPETSLNNLAVVRIAHERGKIPQYIPHEFEKGGNATGRRWVPGVHFCRQSKRVGYALIAEPNTRQKASAENLKSLSAPGENESHKSRAAAAMVEMVLLSQPEWVDDPILPITRSASLRSLNIQYLHQDTTFPFPLHEARLLGKHCPLGRRENAGLRRQQGAKRKR